MGSEWEELRLSDAVNLIGGGTPKRSQPEYWNGPIPWLSVKDFNTDFRHVDSAEESITELGLAKSSTKILEKGQLIISARGTVGALAQLSKSMAFNQSCYGIDSKPGKTINDFLYYLIKCSILNFKQVAHGAVFDTITRETFNHIHVKLPPLIKQKAIAHVLGTLDDRIELNRQMNETLEAMAQALFKSWFVDFDPVLDNAMASGRKVPEELGKRAAARAALGNKRKPLPADIRALFPDEFTHTEELGWIPKGWEVGSLTNVCRVTAGYAFKSKDFTTAGYPVIKIKNINNDRTVNIQDVQYIPEEIANSVNKFHLSSGDLLMAMTGATVGKFGLLVPEDGKTYLLNQRVAKIHTLNNLSEQIWFVYCCLSQKNIFDYIVNVAHGSAQPNISATTIMSTMILKPQDELIRSFDQMVNSNFQKMLLNREVLQTLSKLRDTLLPKLLSGELRIPDAEKMVVEAAE